MHLRSNHKYLLNSKLGNPNNTKTGTVESSIENFWQNVGNDITTLAEIMTDATDKNKKEEIDDSAMLTFLTDK